MLILAAVFIEDKSLYDEEDFFKKFEEMLT